MKVLNPKNLVVVVVEEDLRGLKKKPKRIVHEQFHKILKVFSLGNQMIQCNQKFLTPHWTRSQKNGQKQRASDWQTGDQEHKAGQWAAHLCHKLKIGKNATLFFRFQFSIIKKSSYLDFNPTFFLLFLLRS